MKTYSIIFRGYIPSAVLATLVTFALFLLMRLLITVDFVEPVTEGPRINTTAFDPVREMPPPAPKRFEPPEVIETPTERIETHLPIDTETGNNWPVAVVWQPTNVKVVKVNENSGPIPSVRVEPTYPQAALRRGIEGFVDIMFDISSKGSTENIRIVGSQPQGVFDKAAIKAIARWKFQPANLDGTSVATYDQVTRLRFSISQ